MNSILKAFFQQTEKFLSLTQTSILIVQLQNNLKRDNIDVVDIKHEQYQCTFSYDLCHELRLMQKNLHSTCFILQRALYRVHALRQTRGDLSIQIDDNLLLKYNESLSYDLKNIQEKISSVINEDMVVNSLLNTLRNLFKQIQENYEILINYSHGMPLYKSTLYISSLVSNTLDRFYLILGSLARLIMHIEEFEIK